VLADRGEKQVELTDHGPVHHPAGEFGVQAGQVPLEHRPVYLAEVVNVDPGVCEERRETGDRPGSRGGGCGPQACGQPPPGPSLGQVLQPGLRDVLEADVSWPAVIDAQLAEPPDVPAVLLLPRVVRAASLPLAAGPLPVGMWRRAGDRGW
jgi:hypothetical protein